MKGEKLSTTKTQSDGVAEQRRDIPRVIPFVSDTATR